MVQGIVGVVVFDNGNTDQFWEEPPKVYHTTLVSDRIVGSLERCKFKLLDIRVMGEYAVEGFPEDDA